MKKMSLRELYGSSDSVKLPLKELFDVSCRKCGSNDVEMQTEENCSSGGGGCETCGYGGEGSWSFWLGLKCRKCGNAKVIL